MFPHLPTLFPHPFHNLPSLIGLFESFYKAWMHKVHTWTDRQMEIQLSLFLCSCWSQKWEIIWTYILNPIPTYIKILATVQISRCTKVIWVVNNCNLDWTKDHDHAYVYELLKSKQNNSSSVHSIVPSCIYWGKKTSLIFFWIHYFWPFISFAGFTKMFTVFGFALLLEPILHHSFEKSGGSDGLLGSMKGGRGHSWPGYLLPRKPLNSWRRLLASK